MKVQSIHRQSLHTCGITILSGIIALLCIPVFGDGLIWCFFAAVLLLAVALWLCDLLCRRLLYWRLLLSGGYLLGGGIPENI